MVRSISRRVALGASGFGRLLCVLGLELVVVSPAAFASEPCGTGTYPFPYTDVGSVTDSFCPGIMEAYVTGISRGTTATTFSPNETVIRLQMTTFLQRALDQGLTRTSRRAALNLWSPPLSASSMQTIALTGTSQFCAGDGQYIWTTTSAGHVAQVAADTGKDIDHWTGATSATGVLVAGGKVYVAGATSPGSLYVIDPTQAPGTVTTAASNLGNAPTGIAFDGTHLWTANASNSVSIITPQATTPYPVTTVTTGFTTPQGIVYDGANIWITDAFQDALQKLDPTTGAIVKSVSVGHNPRFPAFDGTNIWVPNNADSSITVVQASSGNVVATIASDASNQLNGPIAAAFDGTRILVTNNAGDSVTVFKAADLSFIANVPAAASTNPFGVCSDGINFWVTLFFADALLRF
jgi:DNA-binding beta-propeller fold protein YncE